MSHLKQSLLLLTALLGMLGMVACDDYSVETYNYVDKTTVSLTGSTLHSLSFKWTSVDDVTKFKWVFLEGDCSADKTNPIAEGTTSDTELSFENLDPGVTYTLWVTPISDSGLVSRSFYGSYSTVAITPLDTPKVTCTLDTITYDVYAEWEPVDLAVDYTWYYVEKGDTIRETTTELSTKFNAKGFGDGQHFFYVIANYYEEAHTNSNRGVGRYAIGKVIPIAELMEGTYEAYSYGYTIYNLSAWAEFEESHNTTITAVDETTIKIANAFKSIGLEGYIDEGTQTITFAANTSKTGAWKMYGSDGSYSYQEETPQIKGYYTYNEDNYDEEGGTYSGYIIYIYDEDYYAWSYGYYYSGYGWYPYWTGESAFYQLDE